MALQSKCGHKVASKLLPMKCPGLAVGPLLILVWFAADLPPGRSLAHLTSAHTT